MSPAHDPLPPGTDAPDPVLPRPPHAQGDMWADDGTSRAEIRTEAGRLVVTLALPDIQPERLAHYVGSNLLLLWSKDDPERQRTMVRLPVDVAPQTSVVRLTNGVFDLNVLLAPSAASSRTESPDTTAGTESA